MNWILKKKVGHLQRLYKVQDFKKNKFGPEICFKLGIQRGATIIIDDSRLSLWLPQITGPINNKSDQKYQRKKRCTRQQPCRLAANFSPFHIFRHVYTAHTNNKNYSLDIFTNAAIAKQTIGSYELAAHTICLICLFCVCVCVSFPFLLPILSLIPIVYIARTFDVGSSHKSETLHDFCFFLVDRVTSFVFFFCLRLSRRLSWMRGWRNGPLPYIYTYSPNVMIHRQHTPGFRKQCRKDAQTISLFFIVSVYPSRQSLQSRHPPKLRPQSPQSNVISSDPFLFAIHVSITFHQNKTEQHRNFNFESTLNNRRCLFSMFSWHDDRRHFVYIYKYIQTARRIKRI